MSAEQVVNEMLEYLKTEKPGLLTTLVKIAEARTYDTSYPPRKLLHRERLITEADVLAKLTEFGAAVYKAHTGNPAVNVAKSLSAALTAANARIVALEAALKPFADTWQRYIDGDSGQWEWFIKADFENWLMATSFEIAHREMKDEGE